MLDIRQSALRYDFGGTEVLKNLNFGGYIPDPARGTYSGPQAHWLVGKSPFLKHPTHPRSRPFWPRFSGLGV